MIYEKYPAFGGYNVFVSNDRKVACYQSRSYSSTVIPIFFWNDSQNTYVQYDVSKPSGASGWSGWYYADMNDSGTLISYANNGKSDLIVVEVDKENKTAQAYYITTDASRNLLGYNHLVFEDYLTLSYVGYKYDRTTHTATKLGEVSIYNEATARDISHYHKVDDHNFYIIEDGTGNINKYTLTDNSYTCISNYIHVPTPSSGCCFSTDGNYAIARNGIWQLDYVNRTRTQVANYTMYDITGSGSTTERPLGSFRQQYFIC